MSHILSIITTGVVVGAFYGLVAVALQISYVGTGVFNFAQGDLVTVGAFAIWSFNVGVGMNVWLALAATCVVGYIVGTLFERVIVRPVAGRPLIQAGLATLAGASILEGIIEIIYGPDTRSVPQFLSRGPFHLGPVVIPVQDPFVVAVVIVAAVSLFVFLRYTEIGLTIRASADNREGATIVGINVHRTSAIVFGLSGLLSAAAGAIMAPIIGASFVAGVNILLVAFTAAVLGGITSTVAVAIGGVLLGLLVTALQASAVAEYYQVGVLAVLLAFMLVRPYGVASGKGTS